MDQKYLDLRDATSNFYGDGEDEVEGTPESQPALNLRWRKLHRRSGSRMPATPAAALLDALLPSRRRRD